MYGERTLDTSLAPPPQKKKKNVPCYLRTQLYNQSSDFLPILLPASFLVEQGKSVPLVVLPNCILLVVCVICSSVLRSPSLLQVKDFIKAIFTDSPLRKECLWRIENVGL
jgi:hypothetical protein